MFGRKKAQERARAAEELAQREAAEREAAARTQAVHEQEAREAAAHRAALEEAQAAIEREAAARAEAAASATTAGQAAQYTTTAGSDAAGTAAAGQAAVSTAGVSTAGVRTAGAEKNGVGAATEPMNALMETLPDQASHAADSSVDRREHDSSQAVPESVQAQGRAGAERTDSRVEAASPAADAASPKADVARSTADAASVASPDEAEASRPLAQAPYEPTTEDWGPSGPRPWVTGAAAPVVYVDGPATSAPEEERAPVAGGAQSVDVSRETRHGEQSDGALNPTPDNGVRSGDQGSVAESTTTTGTSATMTTAEHDHDELRRAALVESLPQASPDTPLMAELQLDARRRIELRGRRFPRPEKTRVITVANQKGGVGKTTTTVNLAAALAQSGLNVLVLDNDPQGNASTALGIDHRAGTPSIYEVLVDGAPIQDAVQESPDVPNLWCLPATIDLSGAEIELVSMVARETRLRAALDSYLEWRVANGQEPIDYVFVDCPPSLGLLTVNAFVVGREVLIPIQCEYYALEGLSQLLKTIQLIQAHLNRDLHVSTILLTMYDARTNLAQQVAEEVRTHFPERTLRTTVPRSVRISEAPSYGQTVITYDAGSTGALAYLEAAREIAERGQLADEGLVPQQHTQSTDTDEPALQAALED